MRFVVAVAFALVALVLWPHEAAAQTFKCRNDLVNVGDSRATVLLKCGEPVVRDAFCRPLPAPGSRHSRRKARRSAGWISFAASVAKSTKGAAPLSASPTA